MPDPSIARHVLRVTIEASNGEGWVTLKVLCESPEGSFCRMSCNEGCEEYAPDHEHPLTDQGECNAALWIDQSGPEISYVGTTQPLTDGAEVEVEWQGDWFGWRLSADSPQEGGMSDE